MTLDRLARNARSHIFAIHEYASALEPDPANPKELCLTFRRKVEHNGAPLFALRAGLLEVLSFRGLKAALEQNQQVDIAGWQRLANRIAAEQVVAPHAAGEAWLQQADDIANDLVDACGTA